MRLGKWIIDEYDEQWEACQFCENFDGDDTCWRTINGIDRCRVVDPDELCCENGYKIDFHKVECWLDNEEYAEEAAYEAACEDRYDAWKNGDYGNIPLARVPRPRRNRR